MSEQSSRPVPARWRRLPAVVKATLLPGRSSGEAMQVATPDDPALSPVRPTGPVRVVDAQVEPVAGFLPGADDEAPVPANRVDALDGVRTLAVALVILYHLGVPGFAGGYLGVDAFFVLSGFLITMLLLRDIVAHGRIDLVRFWARRMARLMPAALLLFLVVGIWSLTAAPEFRRPALGADLLWSLLYVGNWHFISTSSYFAYDGTTSPLIHLWSLGVEEQFYVVWPLILSVVAMLLASMSSGRHARRDVAGARHRTTAAVMITGSLCALWSAVAMARVFMDAGPDRAYMGTDTKMFEPLLGAVFAAAVLRPRVGRWVSRYAAWSMVLGCLGLAAAVALMGGTGAPSAGYFFGGAVATTVAVLAIVAGAVFVPQDKGVGAVFAHPVAAYLGRISYGLYLWHWPWALWLLPEGTFDPWRSVVVVAATTATAAASYHLVEMPLRSGWFRQVRPRRILQTGVAGVTAVCVIPVLLGATPWHAGTAGAVAETSQRSEPTPGKVLLVGDSVPLQLNAAFAAAGQRSGLSVINGSHGGCGASGIITVNPDDTPYNPKTPRFGGVEDGPICRGVIPDQKAHIDADNPSVVLWWSRYEYADMWGPDDKPLRASDPGFEQAHRDVLDAAVARLTARGATLIVVQPEPTGLQTAADCRPDQKDMGGGCAGFYVRMRFEDQVRQQWIGLLKEKAAHDPRVRLITISDVFCRNDANPCDDHLPLSVGGSFPPPQELLARPDGTHFGPMAREAVASTVLERAMKAAEHRP
ncbi:hypothetical protein KEM60_02621 [Austwickia sp. TVS 96-490-7B]|uniref:acyltransferase family protein n=1 Tax=Austwickia sp. TVS 96-490-7B TaxID=2830843 RepID=UPI001D9BE02C|nr:acyltransferase family protein [Austwickia sp. TVS 96-490-7B]MBW3086403.1 hypothetical protein [Austwickia sp. TVS 96-490-7B]